MPSVHVQMYENLKKAMERFQKLSPKEMETAQLQVNKIIDLKYHMEAIADQKGYPRACKASIPICHGDCCKWHFPRNLTYMDFFIAIFHMPMERQKELAELINNNKKNQCPVLLETGCFLSFEQRPVICTNAYPCFNDRSYWIAKEKKNILFQKAIDTLDVIVTRV